MATHAKRAAARRHTHEADARPAQPCDPAVLVAWQEVQEFLDEEVQRLPEGLRAAFIYCCLEHTSSTEAAQQLGVEEATLRKRLSRARKALQERLSQRGVSLTAVLAAAALATDGALAAVPRSLVASTAKAAVLIAAGRVATAGLVSTKVTALTKGALKAMFLTKLKTTAVVLLTVALTGTGPGVLTYRTLAAGQPGGATGQATQPSKASDANQIQKLIDQLGSNRFAEREKATKELEQMGAPALDALRKATQSDDPERKRRAEALVKRLDEQELARRIARLIDQLGSEKLAERENATKELEAIGAPALDALRQAARRDERQRRAEELVNKLEQRARPGGADKRRVQ
jgi:hypothetical protein